MSDGELGPSGYFHSPSSHADSDLGPQGYPEGGSDEEDLGPRGIGGGLDSPLLMGSVVAGAIAPPAPPTPPPQAAEAQLAQRAPDHCLQLGPRLDLATWYAPAPGMQAELATCLREDAVPRRTAALENVRSSMELLFGAVARTGTTREGSARRVQMRSDHLQDTLTESASATFLASRMLAGGLFRSLQSLLAQGWGLLRRSPPPCLTKRQCG